MNTREVVGFIKCMSANGQQKAKCTVGKGLVQQLRACPFVQAYGPLADNHLGSLSDIKFIKRILTKQ